MSENATLDPKADPEVSKEASAESPKTPPTPPSNTEGPEEGPADAGDEPGKPSRKLDGTRVELLTAFVEHLLKKQALFYKRNRKKISVAVLIAAAHSDEQLEAFLKHEEAMLKPWAKKKGSVGGTSS